MMREADMNEKPYGIEIAPTGGDPVFAQRETGVTHTPYETEKVFYSCIRAGDAEGVKKFFGDYLAQGIVVGRMSADPLMQMKYFAVCCVTLACRYAILGGLEESEAFNFSDECIRRVDAMKDGEEIMSFLMRRACDLAERVGGAGTAADVPPPVRKCLNRISRNLHGKITLSELAEHCGLSRDYLSLLFRKSVGCSVSRYVTRRKLEAAKAMLSEGYSVGSVAYLFGFSSESHFIKRFREEYGVTPAKWRGKDAR